MAENPLIKQVLSRYPDVLPGSLTWPPDSIDWAEKDVDLFIGSGGFLKPKKKKAAAAVASTTSNTAPSPGAPASTPPAAHAKESAAPGAKAPAVAAVELRKATIPIGAGVSEVDLMQLDGNRALTPLTTFMEDVGPSGIKLLALANKCEKMRSACLKRGANFDLSTLKTEYGTGILLREFSLEAHGPLPLDIMAILWCETIVELPCSPFIPIRQALFPEGTPGDDGKNVASPIASGIFNLLLLDVRGGAMNVLDDQTIYEKVAKPLRETLGIPRPTGKQGVPKFVQSFPVRGTPFQPQQLFKTQCNIFPSDCDMYRVIFHPQMIVVCERINFAVQADFREDPSIAIYANLAKPASAGDLYDVFVFVSNSADAKQTRVLYLFAAKPRGVPSAADTVMAIFMVYGQPPGALTSEDVGACAAMKFPQLHKFATSGVPGNITAQLDLSKCARS